MRGKGRTDSLEICSSSWHFHYSLAPAVSAGCGGQKGEEAYICGPPASPSELYRSKFSHRCVFAAEEDKPQCLFQEATSSTQTWVVLRTKEGGQLCFIDHKGCSPSQATLGLDSMILMVSCNENDSVILSVSPQPQAVPSHSQSFPSYSLFLPRFTRSCSSSRALGLACARWKFST